MSDPFTLVQDIFEAPHPPIVVTTCPLASLNRRVMDAFLDTVDDGIIGVAPAYGTRCILSQVALASSSKVLIIYLTKKRKGKAKNSPSPGRDLLEKLLLSSSQPKFAFQMDVLASSLYFDFGLRVRSAVDLLSVSKKNDRHSLAALMTSIGGVSGLTKPGNVISLFKGEENLSKTAPEEVALQAWVAWRAATLDSMTALLNKEPRIDTSTFSEPHLTVLATMVRDARRLSMLKPTSSRNEIANDHTTVKDRLHVTCTRFKSRVRHGDTRPIEIQFKIKGKRTTMPGRATKVDGRSVQMNLPKALPPGTALKLTTVGREPLTNAEAQRVDIVLKALQRKSSIAEKPFFQAIWLPQETPSWPASSTGPVPIHFSRPLNDSQKMAVAAIVAATPLTVIHGPPGTGKTTVIAAAVTSINASPARDRTIWLVAQSNVAVKNIAEKLASVDFLDFKLVVSKDFHYDWHEHLYEKINPNLIRSDILTDDLVATERLLLRSKVILCTLSMVSNHRISPIARLVPLQTVIVDEASQVEIGNYLPMIERFSTTLRKLVFIGDDKQLAPFGQSDVPSLQSVFELEHLRKGAMFLNTQYRMPTQLGTFIGKHVYNNKLKTVHPHKSPCCRFLDVKKSKETVKGTSWINDAEVRAAIREARKCDNKGRSYRIITPYDAQRGKIEDALKSEKIPWEDRVFCVDSFQGNEDDYIILSIVRTEKIGFLAEQRRVNVMLSRCKRELTICTSRAFVENTAKDTLVGLLAGSMGEGAWEG